MCEGVRQARDKTRQEESDTYILGLRLHVYKVELGWSKMPLTDTAAKQRGPANIDSLEGIGSSSYI